MLNQYSAVPCFSPCLSRTSSASTLHRLPEGHPAGHHARFQSLDLRIESLPPRPSIPRAASHPTFRRSPRPESPSFTRARFIDTLRCDAPSSHDTKQLFESASESSASTVFEEERWCEGAVDEGTCDRARTPSAAESLMTNVLNLYASDSEDEGLAAKADSSFSSDRKSVV